MEQDSIREHFRRWGYLQAQIDPLDRLPPFPHRDLDQAPANLAEKWREIYCGNLGVEFMHMPYSDRCDWVAARLEQPRPKTDQRFILSRLADAEIFENYLHTRYVGTKRFSLEGLAMLIPAIDIALERAADLGFETVMIGMSHRGRLNAMHHIAGTLASNLFAGFEDIDPKAVLGSGDVKYHRGATGVYQTQSGKSLRIHLASNPSHLEAVNPVLTGRVRARQERLGDHAKEKVLAMLLHGDAAFAGQGIAAETLNFAELNGFSVGGTLHIIVNNLIGFTAEPEALHSGRFATDIAKRLPIPIFHVNAEKPDTVAHSMQIAVDYRAAFKSDVVVDLMGYRRYGHSEIDDPTLTSPAAYKKIAKLAPLYISYAKTIGLSDDEIKSLEEAKISNLKEEHEKGRAMKTQPSYASLPEYWGPYVGGLYSPALEVETSVPAKTLEEIGQVISNIPKDFNIHAKLEKTVLQRYEMACGKRPVDWGTAETLAFGSILLDGHPVRITGQDSGRGTFNHRHAVWYDTETFKPFIPLCHLKADQVRFDVYNSMLSEAAAVGFEYGFSRDYPEALVCWEAQFGDFANGAQIIIDQFITAGEDKWSLLSGLVMLLPHGYEGQGPEHSSARLERFLQVAGEDNIQVCYPSNAAQYFHLLRRQVLRKWRKPLIVMTPKSMLRTPTAASDISAFTSGRFFNVLDDDPAFSNAKRLLICTGKIVHELRAERKKLNNTDVAIITLEQLYPFPEEELVKLLAQYSEVQSIIWVQEEPANMGALFFVRPFLDRLSGSAKFSTIKRSASASPATGSPKAHAMEQEALLKLAFTSYK